MKKKILCFDLDNTICTTFKSNYKSSKPKKKIIKIINEFYDQGHEIKIYTARFMGRNSDNEKKIRIKDKTFTINQLKSWGLKYHRIFFGKPNFDILFDDKSFEFSKRWFDKINKL